MVAPNERNIKMIIKLSPRDISMCKQGANLRWQIARASGVGNQKRDLTREDSDLDFLGLKAELSVAKILGIEHNLFQLGIDDGADLWYGDISIDVKATFHKNGRLLFKSKQSFRSNCAILVCQENEEEMNVVGYIPRKVFLSDCYEKDLGHGVGFMMDQSNLRPLSNLWEVYVKRKFGQ